MKSFNVDLLDDEIKVAEKIARSHLEKIVDSIVLGPELKEDQIRIIWSIIETFANQCNKEYEVSE